jgi:hypothetical protein
MAGMLSHPGSGLGELLQVARKLDRADRALAAALSPEVGSRVKCAAISDGHVLLITPSASLASRLRMDSGLLITALAKAGFSDVSAIEVRIGPLPVHESPARQRKALPPAARDLGIADQSSKENDENRAPQAGASTSVNAPGTGSEES